MFTKTFLERIDATNPEESELRRVVGDSMTDFSPGATYWYWPVSELVGSGDYVLEIGGKLEVKRIARLAGDALIMSSTNYPETNETLTPAAAGKYKSGLTGLEVELKIVGKVAGVVKLK